MRRTLPGTALWIVCADVGLYSRKIRIEILGNMLRRIKNGVPAVSCVRADGGGSRSTQKKFENPLDKPVFFVYNRHINTLAG